MIRYSLHHNTPTAPTQDIANNNTSEIPSLEAFPPFQLTRAQKIVLRNLHSKFYRYYPSIPCSQCCMLLLPRQVRWKCPAENYLYPISELFPDIWEGPVHNNKNPAKIAFCQTCANHDIATFGIPPTLDPIPPCFDNVHPRDQECLSLLKLCCSLQRTPMEASTVYARLSGTLGVSRNPRAHHLYTGIMGALLEPENRGVDNPHHIYQRQAAIEEAARYLICNNPLFQNFTISSFRLYNNSIPRASEVSSQTATQFHNFPFPELVVNPTNYHPETHDEDFHYRRLIAGMECLPHGDQKLSVMSDPDAEAKLYPLLYPNGRGHFIKQAWHRPRIDTLAKDAKRKLLSPDSRFRLNTTWMFYQVTTIENRRIHSNNLRLIAQRKHTIAGRPPTANDLLRQSTYGDYYITNEQIAHSIPSFIRSGSTYFKERQHDLHAMISKFGPPSLFVTLTASEEDWDDLQEVLVKTDNGDSTASHRPVHSTIHFLNRYHYFRNKVLKNINMSSFGELRAYFSRKEFQKRQMLHVHDLLWTTSTITMLIAINFIRADIPDPENESELYELVIKYQIHKCNARYCGGPPPPGMTCRKGFPFPISQSTYPDPSGLRYIYRRPCPRSQYVSPYNALFLLAWQAHINVQYVCGNGIYR
jgi:hypothetical protein